MRLYREFAYNEVDELGHMIAANVGDECLFCIPSEDTIRVLNELIGPNHVVDRMLYHVPTASMYSIHTMAEELIQ